MSFQHTADSRVQRNALQVLKEEVVHHVRNALCLIQLLLLLFNITS